MENYRTQYHYDNLIKSGVDNGTSLKKHQLVNEFLKQNDWLFISPIFFQGIELEIISKLDPEDNPKEKILQIISNKFFNISYTASFIEGYCNRCKHFKPFLMSIEHSLILTFQKDYEGAIKTIIPIIEGVIRKYLVEEKGLNADKIQFEKIRKSFDLLRRDLLDVYLDILKNYTTENNEKIEFTELQIINLMKQKTEYYDIWFSFVSDFINKSFYLKTNGQTLTNEVNRHSILHELGNQFEYNFENYIKIYFLLQFMTWAFLIKEKKSPLNEITTLRFAEKVEAYEAIIKYSEKLVYEKHLLYRNYDSYDSKILREQFPLYGNKIFTKKQLLLSKFIKKVSKSFWKKYGFDLYSSTEN